MSFVIFSEINGYGGEIRGQQVATKLGGLFKCYSYREPRPDDATIPPDPEHDCCVYIIGLRPAKEPRYAYYDLMDAPLHAYRRTGMLTRGPLIAISKCHQDYLRERFPGRTQYYIPQHHCNFERIQREDRPVRVVGVLGGYSSIQWPHEALARHFAKHRLKFAFADNVRHRQDVVDFYKTIDVQLVFRPTHGRSNELMRCLSPLKPSNAGSFGIPTVAYPEPGYTCEWQDDMLWGETMADCCRQVHRLMDDKALYQEYANRARVKAEHYHIDRIADLYWQLPGARA